MRYFSASVSMWPPPFERVCDSRKERSMKRSLSLLPLMCVAAFAQHGHGAGGAGAGGHGAPPSFAHATTRASSEEHGSPKPKGPSVAHGNAGAAKTPATKTVANN